MCLERLIVFRGNHLNKVKSEQAMHVCVFKLHVRLQLLPLMPLLILGKCISSAAYQKINRPHQSMRTVGVFSHQPLCLGAVPGQWSLKGFNDPLGNQTPSSGKFSVQLIEKTSSTDYCQCGYKCHLCAEPR